VILVNKSSLINNDRIISELLSESACEPMQCVEQVLSYHLSIAIRVLLSREKDKR